MLLACVVIQHMKQTPRYLLASSVRLRFVIPVRMSIDAVRYGALTVMNLLITDHDIACCRLSTN